jgi:NTP pyrophosphatase (non-canonical NTP hydrolase)
MLFEELKQNIIDWANDRSLIKRTNSTKQALKMVEEVGETCGALIKNKEDDIKDGIGDILVTIIILSEQLGYSPEECLKLAWNEIKDRKGKTVGGTFIKSE